jgi:hypothetical protein
MRSKLNRLLCLLAFAAQLDSGQLRGRFSAPLNREIFRVPPGFDLVVDYGAGNQVCKLRVPALMPTEANKVQNVADMSQKMHAFLAELVPDSMRGKELGRSADMAGAIGWSQVEYEHEEIVQTANGSSDTITVQFKNAACQQPTAH